MKRCTGASTVTVLLIIAVVIVAAVLAGKYLGKPVSQILVGPATEAKKDIDKANQAKDLINKANEAAKKFSEPDTENK